MARYIDADLLMKEFCDFVRPSNNSDFAPVPTWNDAVSLVGSAPTADAVERKCGKWVVIMNEPNITFDECKCSECGVVEYFNKGWKKFNFCPNCGAEMCK